MSKVLVISTHFDDNLEIATMSWAVGNAALAENKEVTIYLQGLAVREAQRGGTKGRISRPSRRLRHCNERSSRTGAVFTCARPA